MQKNLSKSKRFSADSASADQQIWKIYLKADSQFQDWDVLSIENKDYTPLYHYEVAGKEKVHHIKILALRV